MNRLAILGFLSLFISGNDVFFDEIQDMGNNEISINFNVDKVSLVRSYSLEDPSRIVMEVNQSSLPAEINVPYNYPIKKVRASQDGSLTRIVGRECTCASACSSCKRPRGGAKQPSRRSARMTTERTFSRRCSRQSSTRRCGTRS